MVSAFDLRLKKSRVRISAVPLSANNLGQVVHTHVPLSPSSTGQGAVMACGWEGNRRSGVALAMRHRLMWFIHLQVHGLDREMSTLSTLLMGYGTRTPLPEPYIP